MKFTVGFYQDVNRKELLGEARKRHPRGLLVCSICGWAWLTMETAKISNFMTHLGVTCLDEQDCLRRQNMRMRA
jgi:hypothetical protein